jgi:hypothetical protein
MADTLKLKYPHSKCLSIFKIILIYQPGTIPLLLFAFSNLVTKHDFWFIQKAYARLAGHAKQLQSVIDICTQAYSVGFREKPLTLDGLYGLKGNTHNPNCDINK